MPINLSSPEQVLYYQSLEKGDVFEAWEHAFTQRDIHIYHEGLQFIHWSNVEKVFTDMMSSHTVLLKKRREVIIQKARYWESQWPQAKAFYESLDKI